MRTILPALFAASLLAMAARADDTAAKHDAVFIDSAVFDAKMASLLSQQPKEIDVDVTGHVSINALPPRLDKWLARASEKGSLTMTPYQAPQGDSRALMFLAPLLGAVFQHAEDQWNKFSEERALRRVEDYNATVYYVTDAVGEITIKQLVLTRKEHQGHAE